MEIVRKGIDNYARCTHCDAELRYNEYDLHWSHTEENCYYLICPICKHIIWLDKTPEMDRMYNKAWIERHPEDR